MYPQASSATWIRDSRFKLAQSRLINQSCAQETFFNVRGVCIFLALDDTLTAAIVSLVPSPLSRHLGFRFFVDLTVSDGSPPSLFVCRCIVLSKFSFRRHPPESYPPASFVTPRTLSFSYPLLLNQCRAFQHPRFFAGPWVPADSSVGDPLPRRDHIRPLLPPRGPPLVEPAQGHPGFRVFLLRHCVGAGVHGRGEEGTRDGDTSRLRLPAAHCRRPSGGLANPCFNLERGLGSGWLSVYEPRPCQRSRLSGGGTVRLVYCTCPEVLNGANGRKYLKSRLSR